MLIIVASANLTFQVIRTIELCVMHSSPQSIISYRRVCFLLVAVTDLCLRTIVSKATSETSRFQHNQLVELTGISEPPINDLLTLEELRVAGSCEWFTSKQTYVSWRTSWSDSPPFFWLTGNAGSGKSVLCSQVIRDLQKENLRCSYFFFKHGNGTNSSLASCFRALAYQMAKSDEAVIRKVLNVEHGAIPCSQWDERTTWRKLFLECIFRLSKPLPQFWVIDALDECQQFPTLLTMIAKAPSYVRIFLTSRNTPEAQQSLASLGPLVERYQVQGNDILGDLSIFIDSKIESLPAGNDEGRSKLKDKLLGKSSGSFLWVSLIVKELEQAYSEEDAEEVLNEVPEDMNNLYARMLLGLPRHERATRLTQTIFMWTLFPSRALTLDELQCAIKLDINQTVHSLGKSLPAICGQLIGVDQSNRVHSIHQSTQIFLLHQDVVPELAMDKQNSHNRIAQACLKFLAGSQLQGAGMQTQKNETLAINPDTKIVEYACVHFSDHLQKCSSENSMIWNLLCKFLDNNILLWIESLASRAELYHVARTAKNLRAYLSRRLKYMNPLSAGKETLESWITDMIKLSAMFRASLLVSPSSTHALIPALCPSDSIISRTYTSRQCGFSVKGLVNKDWNDCIARIDYPTKQTCAVTLGDRFLAVALSDSTILLYHPDSMQLDATLASEERAKILALSSDCLYLAASGMRKVRIWDTDTRTQIWACDTSHQTLSILFDDENNTLIAATQSGHMLCWNWQEGLEWECWEWSESVDLNSEQPKPQRSPGKVLISSNSNILAACYRGLPIYLFNTSSKIFVGCCRRKTKSMSVVRGNEYLVDALAFNPNAEISMLVASYGDGELAIFDVSSAKLRHCISDIFAHTLACSPDGRTLVTGSSRGSIQIFEFSGIEGEKLTLIYRIDAYEDAVRSVAFSGDSLRFADIRGSQCRVWEPTVLVRSNVEEGSQSELSQAITLAPKSVGMLEGPEHAEITVICSELLGNFVFCGKSDGTVVQFETLNATQQGVLYRHAVNVGITGIAYSEQRCMLMTSDQSGRVLINSINLLDKVTEIADPMTEIRSEESIKSLLPDPTGTRLLIHGKKYANIWTMSGERVGLPIPLRDETGEKIITIHPTKVENFVVIGGKDVHVYFWADGSEIQTFVSEQMGAVSLEITPPTPTQASFVHNSDLSNSKLNRRPIKFVANLANFSSFTSGTPSLEIWPASSLSVSICCPRPEPLSDIDKLASRIRQIIAIAGTQFLFLDKDHWVCSLDLKTPALSAHSVKRHFFLLSEWQIRGGGFIIQYSPSKRDFLIAFKDRLLVIKRGFDFAEPWLNS